MTSTPDAALAHWDIEREIVLSRVIKAKRDVVFAAWTEPEHLPNWFGPAGFRIETKEIDIRVGGLWRFDMIAPNGQLFSNRMQFRRIEPPRLIEIDHGSDIDALHHGLEDHVAQLICDVAQGMFVDALALRVRHGEAPESIIVDVILDPEQHHLIGVGLDKLLRHSFHL